MINYIAIGTVIRPQTRLNGVWILAVTRSSSLHRKVQAVSVARAYRRRHLQLITHIHLVRRLRMSKTILVLSSHAIMVTGCCRFLLRMLSSFKAFDSVQITEMNLTFTANWITCATDCREVSRIFTVQNVSPRKFSFLFVILIQLFIKRILDHVYVHFDTQGTYELS
jgi:hypothetical protein